MLAQTHVVSSVHPLTIGARPCTHMLPILQPYPCGTVMGAPYVDTVPYPHSYSDACAYEFIIAEGDDDMDRIRAELLGFLRRVRDGSTSDMGLVGDDSYVSCVLVRWAYLCTGGCGCGCRSGDG